MKNAFQENFKKNVETLNTINKESLILEVKKLLTKEKSVILDLLKERIEKYFKESNGDFTQYNKLIKLRGKVTKKMLQEFEEQTQYYNSIFYKVKKII
ncbi:hypothetical protein [Borreliella americana]|uniref:hypothetical protein n=1 Tax=Borreliella americana TaxID=478807 RepID=UPI001E3F6CB7|nr:hypothetical protein [Borreliella americana]MCD2332719.1 hypothetical protein [Borreliella americana]MCD2382021.1 hypothetical protein [Borreliella americana]